MFFRDTYYAVWNGLVKGFYHLEDPHPIDEQCMGDWMQGEIDYLTTVLEEFEVFGLQTISYERAMGAAMRSVDLIYNSKFQCQYEDIVYDAVFQALDQYNYSLSEFVTQ